MDMLHSMQDDDVRDVRKKDTDAVWYDTDRAYTAYRQRIGNPDRIPPFSAQDQDVRDAWKSAVVLFTNAGEKSGKQLYQRYSQAVGGVALKNKNVQLSEFEDMPELNRLAWCDAAEKV